MNKLLLLVVIYLSVLSVGSAYKLEYVGDTYLIKNDANVTKAVLTLEKNICQPYDTQFDSCTAVIRLSDVTLSTAELTALKSSTLSYFSNTKELKNVLLNVDTTQKIITLSALKNRWINTEWFLNVFGFTTTKWAWWNSSISEWRYPITFPNWNGQNMYNWTANLTFYNYTGWYYYFVTEEYGTPQEIPAYNYSFNESGSVNTTMIYLFRFNQSGTVTSTTLNTTYFIYINQSTPAFLPNRSFMPNNVFWYYSNMTTTVGHWSVQVGTWTATSNGLCSSNDLSHIWNGYIVAPDESSYICDIIWYPITNTLTNEMQIYYSSTVAAGGAMMYYQDRQPDNPYLSAYNVTPASWVNTNIQVETNPIHLVTYLDDTHADNRYNVTYNNTKVSNLTMWEQRLIGIDIQHFTNTQTTCFDELLCYQYNSSNLLQDDAVLGNATSYLSVSPPVITVYSPQNTTYSDILIPLNVSANIPITSWWYSLNGNANTTFSPNTTFLASVGYNNITVTANATNSQRSLVTIYFTIILPYAPFVNISTASAPYNAGNVQFLYLTVIFMFCLFGFALTNRSAMVNAVIAFFLFTMTAAIAMNTWYTADLHFINSTVQNGTQSVNVTSYVSTNATLQNTVTTYNYHNSPFIINIEYYTVFGMMILLLFARVYSLTNEGN